MSAKAASKAKPAAPAETVLDPNEMVRVYHTNKTGGSLVHGPIIDPETKRPALDEEGKMVEYRLDPGGTALVPRYVADIWLTHQHYNAAVCALTVDEVSPARDRLQKERDELIEENSELAKATNEAADRIAALEKTIAELQKATAPRLPAIDPSPEQLAEDAARKKADNLGT